MAGTVVLAFVIVDPAVCGVRGACKLIGRVVRRVCALRWEDEKAQLLRGMEADTQGRCILCLLPMPQTASAGGSIKISRRLRGAGAIQRS
jgi:hypothetical protein